MTSDKDTLERRIDPSLRTPLARRVLREINAYEERRSHSMRSLLYGAIIGTVLGYAVAEFEPGQKHIPSIYTLPLVPIVAYLWNREHRKIR